jgi:hypothetical protein
LFAVSDAGGERRIGHPQPDPDREADGLNPDAYLRNPLERIFDRPVNRVGEPLPWHINPKQPSTQPNPPMRDTAVTAGRPLLARPCARAQPEAA